MLVMGGNIILLFSLEWDLHEDFESELTKGGNSAKGEGAQTNVLYYILSKVNYSDVRLSKDLFCRC